MSIIIRKTARAGICPACGSVEVEYCQNEICHGNTFTKYLNCRHCQREFKENYQIVGVLTVGQPIARHEVMYSQSITIGETTHEIPAVNNKLNEHSKEQLEITEYLLYQICKCEIEGE